MTGYGDVGEEVIGRLAGRLGCAPHQVTLWKRGLTWHPAGLTQHVWAEAAGGADRHGMWRVQVRTWCLKRVVASSHDMVAALEAEAPLNTVSALIRKPGSPSRVGLGAATHMSDDRVEWTSRVMAAVARLQVHDAIRLTRSADVLTSGAAPDLSTDRLSVGPQETTVAPPAMDPRLLPPASLDDLPFTEVAEALRAHDGVRAIVTHSGVTASFPWSGDGDAHQAIVFEMRKASRPSIGQGVWVSMSLPMAAPGHLLHALALNEAELELESPTEALGGWVVRGTAILHECFVPWSLCAGGVIRHLADGAVSRASWLREAGASIVPAEWPDGRPARVLPFRRPS